MYCVAGSVRVLNTKGGTPSASLAARMIAAAPCAATWLVTNGSVRLMNSRAGNWVSKLCPSVSTVIPVRSET